MRDFPINDLLAATTIDHLTQAVKSIFQHLRKIKNATQYPLLRAFNLVEAVSRDLSTQLLKILSSQRLMQLEFEEFEHATSGCDELFSVWNDEIRQFKDLVREQVKKRGAQERPPPKIHCEHSALQDRIEDLRKFRKQHQKLKEVIVKVLADGRSGELGAHREITGAYALFLNIDVLDVSRPGTDAWEAAKKQYDDKIDRVESQITSKLRDRLGAAKTASEMFRVFSKFNALFFRPRIKGAIQEYQAALINEVKDDIQKLQEKFKDHYLSTQACKMATLRDIPQTSGAIIWANQIQRRLQVLMKRVEDVLGKGWEQHVEGQKLKQERDAFARKVNSQAIFENWLKEIKDARNFDVQWRIFEIKHHSGGYELTVNYDEQIITLFKEVRNLQSLGLRVPYSIKVTSDEAKLNYPFAMTLLEAVRTYMQTCNMVDHDSTLAPLVASTQKAVHEEILEEGLKLKWDSDRLETFARKFADRVFTFQDRVTEVTALVDKTNLEIEALQQISLVGEESKLILERLQKTVDDMNLANYSNLNPWVAKLDKKLEEILVSRLERMVEDWVVEFHKWPEAGTELIHEGTLHELKIQNQVLYMEPPGEGARRFWTKSFHQTLGKVCGLPRLKASRFDAFARGGAPQDEATFQSIVKLMNPQVLQKAHDAIESVVTSMEDYVATWFQYQSLWDIESQTIFSKLGDDLDVWTQLLNEIKASRSTFDNSEYEKVFGPIVVDYRQIQSKVNNKYDAWHKEILHAFGQKIAEHMNSIYKTINSARFVLEKQSLDNGFADAIAFVTNVQEMKKLSPAWATQLESLRCSQRLLERQRFVFPSDWLWLARVEGEWEAFEQILNRKLAMLDKDLPNLKGQIIHQDRLVDDKIKLLFADWVTQKPLQGDVKPGQAIDVLNLFEGKLGKVKDDFHNLMDAKKALNMEVGNSEILNPLEEEVTNLKYVWSELSAVFNMLDNLKETPWSAVVPKKVRQGIEEVLQKLKSMPGKLRQYEAFENVQTTLNQYLSVNIFLVEMKSEALKDRHWKELFKRLKIHCAYQDLTLGHLWDAGIGRHDNSLKEILTQAQGEMALEEFLRQVKDLWLDYELELVPYKNKCRLIRGWDELFCQMDEHINSITSMKMSPYFKVFEEEAITWDERLNRLRLLFDAWIDVQRRWVYLEGIFYGSADIQTLLPNEYARFRTIDNDVVQIMKKVAQKPKVLDVANIEGIQKSLDRLADLLSKIQKALGDYLEKQRSQFARFYFVGDEDLLEMIGNSKDVKVVQRHLGKMFQGLALLLLDENDPDIVIGMGSREGEEVMFEKSVKISEDTSINAWLGKIERQMKETLCALLDKAVADLHGLGEDLSKQKYLEFVAKYPAQVVGLSIQVDWTHKTDKALINKGLTLENQEQRCVTMLTISADQVLDPKIEKHDRAKHEQLITELVHERDIMRELRKLKIDTEKSFEWLKYMRMYFDPKVEEPTQRLSIQMANANFEYGFEYLGVCERLVQTPLTDRCYLTLTQALHMRLGGNPFGPAGTGKTETVKALGAQLGRFVLVFCCDEAFDFQAMGRIFVGLCQVGAWGCFDEFNRLQERILSAVSEQILCIQVGLKAHASEIELLNKHVKLSDKMGIFVTMNPGYAGRSNLPDNLKQLFREIAMIKPDKDLIAQVMLYSQGFQTAERISSKIVSLFDLCQNQLSSQPHYDFGLRALKCVLNSAGALKRQANSDNPNSDNLQEQEQSLLIRSVCDTVVPKLVGGDVPLLRNLLDGVFPGTDLVRVAEASLEDECRRIATSRHYRCTDKYLEKVLQLYQIQRLTHGVMMVGPVGVGKTAAWTVLLDAMQRMDGIKGDSYIVDPKAISKDDLYGKLDPTTLEWTDGVFTEILRRILNSMRGEKDRRHWIIFDGDVDPEWAENLNSVLDDNKLLTLPNGERLAIPSNVRIMFEVDTLKHATLATVSRCGMVWFSDDIVTMDMIFHRNLNQIKFGNIEPVAKAEEEVDLVDSGAHKPTMFAAKEEDDRTVNHMAVDILSSFFEPGELVELVIRKSKEFEHVMIWTSIRVIEATFSLIRKAINNVKEYNEAHSEFHMPREIVEKYLKKSLLSCLCWGCGGAMGLDARMEFCTAVAGMVSNIPLPPAINAETTILDFEVRIEDGEWHHWRERVPVVDVSPERVTDADLVITTVDTQRHRHVLAAWLEERMPLILCGPPGSGKTMTLSSTLKALSDFDMASLNFSSGSSPDLLLKTFDHYCEYVKTPAGFVLRPTQPGRWLIVFCDEINLPTPDKYSTQRIIFFLRQMTEQNGFWRPSDRQWIRMERIQFVGACNPPTDAGRNPMSDRFLRHAPLLFVDYPGAESLKQIYGTFNRAMLKQAPALRNLGDPLTDAMVEFYRSSQKKFTVEMQPQYLYSPRELTRWKVAMFEAICGKEETTVAELVRLFIHEGLRIFHDRLVDQWEREWTDETINDIATRSFGVDPSVVKRPILFSCYMARSYQEVNREELRILVQDKLKLFNEEELNVQLVIFDQVLDHIVRIDRVLRQPLGHLLLVGASGAGKTVLSKYVSWMNGLSVFQIRAGRNYDTIAFEADLRLVMKRSGIREEKICFIFDESNALGTQKYNKKNQFYQVRRSWKE
eukprot:GHVL01042788.1.p1 GENE.GHVL01042788.1~~GHVL01042788.1.p1  ORF type:complete len:2866 (+),score=438.01 GHVL01042788.1:781-8598(+)